MAVRTKQEVHDFLEEAFERFKAAELCEAEWRREAVVDLKFYDGDQWDETARRRRKKNRQPILTINRLKQFKRQITNEIRAQRPSIQLNPREDATVATAQLLQGHVRDIEVDSCADMTYDLGTDQMVITGLGYWRVCTEYRDGRTFDQKVVIDPIKNHLMVYDDPDCEKLDRSDRRWLFIVQDMDKEDFKAKYPDSLTASALQQMQSIGDNAKSWLKEGGVRVAEYYTVEDQEEKLYELIDGRLTTEEPDVADTIERQRTVCVPKVCWHKISALDILEEREVPCEYIPVVVVIGEESNINGKLNWSGMVRDSRDAQRAYNYWKTAATSQIALAAKAPFVAASGQIQNHEGEWQNAHLEDPAVLTYEPMVEGNQLLPPPARDLAEPPIQAMNAMMGGAANDLMATTGLNDASLGERRPDEAAKSVLLRQNQGHMATSHYSDNVSRAVRFTGMVVLSFLKLMDEAPRQARVIKPDDTVDHVVLHKNDAEGARRIAKPNQKVINLAEGSYDVTVSVGPSYQTKRQEAVQSILSLIQAVPQTLNLVGDLLVGNMDWHNAPEIAKRLKKMLPPQLQDQDLSGDPAENVQKLQSALQQLQAQHEQLMKSFQSAVQVINTKQIEANSRQRVAEINAAAGVTEASIKAMHEGNMATLNAELDALQARFQLLHAQPNGSSAPAGGQQ